MNPDTALELRKFVAPEFIYGTGALTQIGRYAKNFGAQKALVVTDPGVAQTVWVEATWRKAGFIAKPEKRIGNSTPQGKYRRYRYAFRPMSN